MEDLLVRAGLTDTQASVYLFLLEHGEAAPPAIATALHLTRSNAYKILERLEEIGFAFKTEADKKFAYTPADPTALASLVAEERNRVVALEQTVNEVMQQLRAKYRTSTASIRITTGRGKLAIVSAYEEQAAQKQPIYFIKSRADIPFMGYETMDRLRKLPAKQGTKRFGITPDGAEAPVNPKIDEHSNLVRNWIPAEDYTASLEWSVSGNELLITIFEGEGRTIRIQDAAVADAFRQIWKIIDKNVSAQPSHTTHGPKSKRQV